MELDIKIDGTVVAETKRPSNHSTFQLLSNLTQSVGELRLKECFNDLLRRHSAPERSVDSLFFRKECCLYFHFSDHFMIGIPSFCGMDSLISSSSSTLVSLFKKLLSLTGLRPIPTFCPPLLRPGMLEPS